MIIWPLANVKIFFQYSLTHLITDKSDLDQNLC